MKQSQETKTCPVSRSGKYGLVGRSRRRRASRSGLDEEHQRDHSEAGDAEDPENVDEGEHGGLALEFVVQESLRLVERRDSVGTARAEHGSGAL